MHIIHIFPSFNTYPDRFRSFAALKKGTHDVTIICKDSPVPDPLAPEVSVIHGKGKVKGVLFLLFAILRTIHTIRTIPPRIPVIVHDHFFPWTSPLIKHFFPRRTIRTVFSAYASNHALYQSRYWHRRGHFNLRREIHYRILLAQRIVGEWLAIRSCDLCSGNCQEIIDHFVRYLGLRPDKDAVIPTAVDTDFFIPAPRPAGATTTLLVVGRILLYRKGIDTILAAFALLGHTCTNLRLLLVGTIDPYDASDFQQAIESHPLRAHIKVIPSQPRDTLLAYYQQSHLMISASLNEGSPRTVREALSCNLPCVLSDISGHRAIDPLGEVCHFFPVGNADALCQTLQKVVSAPIVTSSACREHIVRQASIPVVAATLHRIYADLIAN